MNDFERIRCAIEFISVHRAQQPKLEQLAEHMQLSPSHMQKLFLRWAGLTPKRFLQALTIEDAKRRLAEGQSVLHTAEHIGLSSASRLYDHFIELEALTPGEFKRAGADLSLAWGNVSTPFGEAFIGFSERGISQLSFIDATALDVYIDDFQSRWHAAKIVNDQARAKTLSEKIFCQYSGNRNKQKIKLCIQGTNFQVAVWRALLQMHWGQLKTYSELAGAVHKPKAVRAVASAVAANPIACLIPCHRIIRRTGALGGYRWGEDRKQAILLKELKS